jgi:hypothetical protein
MHWKAVPTREIYVLVFVEVAMFSYEQRRITQREGPKAHYPENAKR